MRVDFVPELARPGNVTEAIAEANALRDRVREAAEAAALAQSAVDEAEREDVERAAQAARSGAPLGSAPAQLAKLRTALEARKRDHLALTLALKLAEEDLAQTLAESAEAWLVAATEAREQARKRAVEALAALEAALVEIDTCGSTVAWVREGKSSGLWDRRPVGMLAGSIAMSSRRLTANSSPLSREQVISFCRELIEPLPTQSGPVLHVAEHDAA